MLAGQHVWLNLHADIDVDVAAALVQRGLDIVVLALSDRDPLGVALAVAIRVILRVKIGVAVGRPCIAVHERLGCSRVERVSDTHLEGALVVTAHKEADLTTRWCLEVALESRESVVVAQSLRQVDRCPRLLRDEAISRES